MEITLGRKEYADALVKMLGYQRAYGYAKERFFHAEDSYGFGFWEDVLFELEAEHG